MCIRAYVAIFSPPAAHREPSGRPCEGLARLRRATDADPLINALGVLTYFCNVTAHNMINGLQQYMTAVRKTCHIYEGRVNSIQRAKERTLQYILPYHINNINHVIHRCVSTIFCDVCSRFVNSEFGYYCCGFWHCIVRRWLCVHEQAHYCCIPCR